MIESIPERIYRLLVEAGMLTDATQCGEFSLGFRRTGCLASPAGETPTTTLIRRQLRDVPISP